MIKHSLLLICFTSVQRVGVQYEVLPNLRHNWSIIGHQRPNMSRRRILQTCHMFTYCMLQLHVTYMHVTCFPLYWLIYWHNLNFPQALSCHDTLLLSALNCCCFASCLNVSQLQNDQQSRSLVPRLVKTESLSFLGRTVIAMIAQKWEGEQCHFYFSPSPFIISFSSSSKSILDFIPMPANFLRSFLRN